LANFLHRPLWSRYSERAPTSEFIINGTNVRLITVVESSFNAQLARKCQPINGATYNNKKTNLAYL